MLCNVQWDCKSYVQCYVMYNETVNHMYNVM